MGMAESEGGSDDVEVDEVEAEAYVWEEGLETLEPKEWDFDEFKRDKMKAWMGMAESEGGSDDVEVDEGFADVDRAVAEQEKSKGHDPMGGRGSKGHITQQRKRPLFRLFRSIDRQFFNTITRLVLKRKVLTLERYFVAMRTSNRSTLPVTPYEGEYIPSESCEGRISRILLNHSSLSLLKFWGARPTPV